MEPCPEAASPVKKKTKPPASTDVFETVTAGLLKLSVFSKVLFPVINQLGFFKNTF